MKERITEKELLEAVLSGTISVKEAKLFYEDWFSDVDANYAKALKKGTKTVLKNEPLMKAVRSYFATPKGQRDFNLGTSTGSIAYELYQELGFDYREVIYAVNAYFAEMKGTKRNADAVSSVPALRDSVVAWLRAHKADFVGGGVGVEGSEDIALAFLESDEGKDVSSDDYDAVTSIVRKELAKLRSSGEWK